MTDARTSRRIALPASDPVAAIEYCYEQGWTDGLPVVPPVRWRVEEMLAAGGRSGDLVIVEVPFRRRTVTVEKIAINAVMAGCQPGYFPVVLAAVDVLARPDFPLHLAAASTHSPALLLLINGPLRGELGVNCANNVFSPGWRANATIGRALRLILLNCLGANPAFFDGGTLGNPAKYSYCIGEYEEVSPWEPLHVERGLAANENAVTVFMAEAPRVANSRISPEPEIFLLAVADMMAVLGNATSRPDEGGFLIVMSPEHASGAAARGWSKNDVRRFLFERSQRPVADYKRAARISGELEPGDEERPFPIVAGVEDLFVAVAGSQAGRYTAVISIQPHHEVFTQRL